MNEKFKEFMKNIRLKREEFYQIDHKDPRHKAFVKLERDVCIPYFNKHPNSSLLDLAYHLICKQGQITCNLPQGFMLTNHINYLEFHFELEEARAYSVFIEEIFEEIYKKEDDI